MILWFLGGTSLSMVLSLIIPGGTCHLYIVEDGYQMIDCSKDLTRETVEILIIAYYMKIKRNIKYYSSKKGKSGHGGNGKHQFKTGFY